MGEGTNEGGKICRGSGRMLKEALLRIRAGMVREEPAQKLT